MTLHISKGFEFRRSLNHLEIGFNLVKLLHFCNQKASIIQNLSTCIYAISQSIALSYSHFHFDNHSRLNNLFQR